MNSNSEGAQHILNTLQNAVNNIGNDNQAGGKKRRSKRSKKSMKGGAVQEGGKRRKSRKSKKSKRSMKGGEVVAAQVVAAQEGGKRRKSRKSKKSKKSMKGGAEVVAAQVVAAQEGGKRRKSRKSKKSKKSMKGGAVAAQTENKLKKLMKGGRSCCPSAGTSIDDTTAENKSRIKNIQNTQKCDQKIEIVSRPSAFSPTGFYDKTVYHFTRPDDCPDLPDAPHEEFERRISPAPFVQGRGGVRRYNSYGDRPMRRRSRYDYYSGGNSETELTAPKKDNTKPIQPNAQAGGRRKKSRKSKKSKKSMKGGDTNLIAAENTQAGGKRRKSKKSKSSKK